ncbi:hypothetical protein N8E87_03450 [Avibacterium paragallinarum]|uniref:Uncharacterized protein n=1 Tax=Avibacterium paragallinarum TaxID=728 RepID=A0A0F5EUK8_AVIPA|nr:hypothetical protein [Avibacterium paragallinarum]KKB00221.1 hypothetical protein Z012_11645 [Avibacterium paragallinarum]UXN37540.1 hypothetical protein N8E87_03450 [Avibacterium paragallinarum]SUU97556.1 Uncharacterised protein [Avibacterium paragallinarum]
MNEYKCPKCGGELSDLWDRQPVNAFIGEYSDDRFRCEGKLKEAKHDRMGEFVWVNRTKSCGYFSLDELGIESDGN